MNKPAIILIHGFRGTHHGLELIAQNLKGFETIIPDLPGFGEGEKLEKYDLDGYVAWLHGYIKQLGLKTLPILLGHSFGSIITAAYAAQYPAAISKLVLVNPISTPALEGPQKIMTKLALFYYLLGRKLPGKPAHAWLSLKPIVLVMSAMMAKTKDKDLRAFIHQQHLTYFSRFHNPQSLDEAFVTSVTHNVRESAPAIKVPTLLIAGDKDDIAPLAGQKKLVPLFPSEASVELKIIKNVGHLTHYETPDQVAAFVQSFIKSV